MRSDAIELEEGRLEGIGKIEDYPWFKDRHRVFPAVFENRQHKRILDASAGVGCTAKRISEQYNAELVCNDISPTCIKILQSLNLPTVSFDLDDREKAYPFTDGYFDAVISLVTLEHLIHPDHFLGEVWRILQPGGHLYISTPNYAALYYVLRLLFTGKSFHDPLEEPYEFYAHVRYYTYRTFRDLISSYGYSLDTVYIALPQENTQFQELRANARIKAWLHRHSRWLMYHLLSPRWTAEPILCFQKAAPNHGKKVRKVVL